MKLVVAGVGGQGVLSSARFLALAAHRAGLPVVAGQLHGMAQRGGSVTATVVVGGSSSIVEDGAADVLLATEPLEALRALPRLADGGLAITNTRALRPAGAAARRAATPTVSEVLAALHARAARVVALDASALALRAGSPQAVNIVLLGALAESGATPIGAAELLAAIEETCPPTAAPLNRLAFELGRRAG